jgi:hypothetical protein
MDFMAAKNREEIANERKVRMTASQMNYTADNLGVKQQPTFQKSSSLWGLLFLT